LRVAPDWKRRVVDAEGAVRNTSSDVAGGGNQGARVRLAGFVYINGDRKEHHRSIAHDRLRICARAK